MSNWNPVFVNEMSHAYRRFLKTKDDEVFKEILMQGLLSDDSFIKAFTAGLVTWMSAYDFDLTDHIQSNSALQEQAYPAMFDHPAIQKKPEDPIPEFAEYGVLISYFN